jgi:alpha-amylase
MINGTDMRTLQYTGLVNKEGYKNRAVTFVDNHDTNRDGKSQEYTEENTKHMHIY